MECSFAMPGSTSPLANTQTQTRESVKKKKKKKIIHRFQPPRADAMAKPKPQGHLNTSDKASDRKNACRLAEFGIACLVWSGRFQELWTCCQ